MGRQVLETLQALQLETALRGGARAVHAAVAAGYSDTAEVLSALKDGEALAGELGSRVVLDRPLIGWLATYENHRWLTRFRNS